MMKSKLKPISPIDLIHLNSKYVKETKTFVGYCPELPIFLEANSKDELQSIFEKAVERYEKKHPDIFRDIIKKGERDLEDEHVTCFSF